MMNYELQVLERDVDLLPTTEDGTVELFFARGRGGTRYAVLLTDSAEVLGGWCDILRKAARAHKVLNHKTGDQQNIDYPDW